VADEKTGEACQQCGRCCTFPDPFVAVVPELSYDDLSRLTERDKKELVVEMRGRFGIRAMTTNGRSRCSALIPLHEGKALCSIYNRRPEMCRGWESGGSLCKHLRSLQKE